MFTDDETLSAGAAKAWDSPGSTHSSALHKDVLNSYIKKIIQALRLEHNREPREIRGRARRCNRGRRLRNTTVLSKQDGKVQFVG